MNIFVYVHYFAARWAQPYNQDNAVSLEEYCWEKQWKLEISVGPDNETQKVYTDRKRNYTLEDCCKSSGYSTKMRQISNRKTSGCQMPELLLIQILPTRVMQEYVILTKQRISWQCACANNFFITVQDITVCTSIKITYIFQSVFIQYCNLILKMSIFQIISLWIKNIAIFDVPFFCTASSHCVISSYSNCMFLSPYSHMTKETEKPRLWWQFLYSNMDMLLKVALIRNCLNYACYSNCDAHLKSSRWYQFAHRVSHM